ncbi:hypothetical protein [Prosthecobacter sp.]|uniref:hypothetical protein n=1 Tax=Prosthecobacter sp. TaxID=1965333 RepID=UPI0037831C3A
MSKKSKSAGIHWLKKIEEHDYPAAQSYLLLLYDKKQVKKIISQLKVAEVTQFKSRDIFRASGLSLLGVSNSHVEKDSKKIRDGKALSPLLLVRDPLHGKVIIADGYHRLCAIYNFDEDAWIHCKIV